MECTISGMCIIRKTLMTLAFCLFLVCASFGFFPPIVLPRWLSSAVHHVKVVRRTGKSQNNLRHMRNPHLPMRNSQLSLDQYQTTLQSSGNAIDYQRYPQISFSQCYSSGWDILPRRLVGVFFASTHPNSIANLLFLFRKSNQRGVWVWVIDMLFHSSAH